MNRMYRISISTAGMKIVTFLSEIFRSPLVISYTKLLSLHLITGHWISNLPITSFKYYFTTEIFILTIHFSKKVCSAH
jgi:hypothetical protein